MKAFFQWDVAENVCIHPEFYIKAISKC